MNVSARLQPSYAACRWLLIPVVALHNAEEWIAVPYYGSIAPALQAHATGVLASPPFRVLQIGWMMVTLVPALIVLSAASAHRSASWDWLVCWVASIYLANAIMPHLIEFAISRSYAPGLITAAFVNLPFTLALLRRALVERILSRRQLSVAVAAGFVALPVVLAAAYVIASAIASPTSRAAATGPPSLSAPCLR